MPQCKTVDIDFIQRATTVVRSSTVLDASAEAVFGIFSEAEEWPKWFKGITKVVWTTPKPFGVGTTRTVSLGALKVEEYFFAWEDDRRFAFCFTSTNLPFVKALVEEYCLVPLGENSCEFTYTVAYDPALPLRLTGPIGRAALRRTFKQATRSLQRYVKKNY